ncbi:arginine N-succinyltransferase [Psychromonas sp. GE-S-Ul-11]|uniref:arginine N-succinyltransferase n=1 Tax=Psychromonas sp. GE-S-Ul-11 TaxID=3241170 RepID=UPI00390CD7A5
MMIIRPVTREDQTAIYELAGKTGIGFTSLPENNQLIEQRIERMLKTREGGATKAEQGYLFVLEDTELNKVVGVSGIETALGLIEPWYNYHVGTLTNASKELGIYNQMETLTLSNNHTGYSELCTLFLDPEYRHSKNGHLLSKARLLFIAQFKEHFSEKLIAEMRGVSDEKGVSPFWESLGRHFFTIDFSYADYLTGIGKKSFIAELMPTHPLYVNFLTPEAQEVIGKTHKNTIPARKILESEGMRYGGYVDIFDAGPTLETYVNDLRIVKTLGVWPIKIVSEASADQSTCEVSVPYMVSNQRFSEFRAMLITPIFSDSHLIITEVQAKALHLSSGDSVSAAPLFPAVNKNLKEAQNVAA